MSLRHLMIAAALIASPAVASATSLVDGSFEAKGAATSVGSYCYDQLISGVAHCGASPWVGTSGIIKSNEGAWGGTPTPAGDYYAFVQGLSTLEQSFTATATHGLGVTWLDAGRKGNNGNPQSYTVSIEHGASSVLIGSYSTNGGVFTARSSSPFAVVSGETYTLVFTGLSADDRTSFIDNVALGVVPEPATWAMLFGGFSLVGFAMRRRQGAVAA
jgi:hypothetical protein